MRINLSAKFTIPLIILALTLIIAILLSLFGKEENNPPGQAMSQSPQTSAVKYTAAHVPPGKTIEVNRPDTDNFQFCTSLMKDYRELGGNWFHTKNDDWKAYLAQGYPLDEVTLLIEHFGNSNFAASFRVEQLRKQSELSQTNNKLMKLAKSIVPELFESSGFGLMKRIPASHLSDYHKLSPNQRRAVLEQHPVSVDDAAYFIYKNEITEERLIELLNAVAEPSSTVGYQQLETTSLLDYAVYASNVAAVENLLQRGVLPTNNPYLGTSMDWALTKLKYRWKRPEREAAVKIVQLLKDAGAGAKIKLLSEKAISGDFPRHSWKFDQRQIEELYHTYGLDLTTINRITPLTINSNSELFSRLQEEKEQFLAHAMSLPEIKMQHAQCQKTIQNIADAWQHDDPLQVLNQLVSTYGNNVSEIENRLSEIDPNIVDLYRRFYQKYRMPRQPIPGANNLLRPLSKGQIDEVIASFQELNLNDANKNWLVFQILGYDPTYYGRLVDAGFVQGEIQYFEYTRKLLSPEVLSILADAGADLYHHDALGKTLLYYAVNSGDIGLVNYMADENIPFKLQNTGEDPLHLALSATQISLSPDELEQLLPPLMHYNPEIDRFHLSRMALIKLQYPGSYQRISARYPQLAITDDTQLPTVSFVQSY